MDLCGAQTYRILQFFEVDVTYRGLWPMIRGLGFSPICGSAELTGVDRGITFPLPSTLCVLCLVNQRPRYLQFCFVQAILKTSRPTGYGWTTPALAPPRPAT